AVDMVRDAEPCERAHAARDKHVLPVGLDRGDVREQMDIGCDPPALFLNDRLLRHAHLPLRSRWIDATSRIARKTPPLSAARCVLVLPTPVRSRAAGSSSCRGGAFTAAPPHPAFATRSFHWCPHSRHRYFVSTAAGRSSSAGTIFRPRKTYSLVP